MDKKRKGEGNVDPKEETTRGGRSKKSLHSKPWEGQERRYEMENRLRQNVKEDSSDENETTARNNSKPRRKKYRKRAKRSRSNQNQRPVYRSKRDSSCSCGSLSSGSAAGNCSCECCCSSSVSCTSTDSDERFARYYKLSSDEMELRGIDFPLESKKKRREMTKLLLHTMVMWDDIWTGKITDNEDKRNKRQGLSSACSSSSSSETTTDSDYHDYQKWKTYRGEGPGYYTQNQAYQPDGSMHRNDEEIILKDEDLKDMTLSKRLKQTLALKQEHGVFFSGKWYGLPIEEIDPFIYEDTYVVLSWRPKGPCLVYRFYKGESLGMFAPDHPVRTFAFQVITHRFFTKFIILTIFANCITLAMERYDYTEYGKKYDTVYDKWIAWFE